MYLGAAKIRGMRAACAAMVVVVCLLGTGVSAAAQETTLIQFELEDQFKTKHTDDELRGKVVILAGGGRAGSEHLGGWSAAVLGALDEAGDREDVVLVPYADTRGVPFFIKGMVRSRMSQDPDEWTLLDWKGTIAKAYSMDPDQANLLLFDRGGRLVARTAGQSVERARLDAFVASVLETISAEPERP